VHAIVPALFEPQQEEQIFPSSAGQNRFPLALQMLQLLDFIHLLRPESNSTGHPPM
jgi:hypothetical protein